MPISVVCSGCGAKLNAPDTAAGKRVKCPKPDCGSTITVPSPVAEFEDVDEEPPAKPKKAVAEADEDAPKKPRKVASAEADEPARKRRRAAEEDEDEEEDEAPRRGKRKEQKAAALSPAVIAAIAVVGLLVLGGVGYGIYALASKKEETAGPIPPPPGGTFSPGVPGGPPGPGASHMQSLLAEWKDYTSEKDKFKLRMPASVRVNGNPARLHDVSSTDMRVNAMVTVYVLPLPANLPPNVRKELAEEIKNGATADGVELKRSQAQLAGQTVTERTVEMEMPGPTGAKEKRRVYIRDLMTETQMYSVMVTTFAASPDWIEPNAVFATFELLK